MTNTNRLDSVLIAFIWPKVFTKLTHQVVLSFCFLTIFTITIFSQDNRVVIENLNGQEAVIITADSLDGGKMVLFGLDSSSLFFLTDGVSPNPTGLQAISMEGGGTASLFAGFDEIDGILRLGDTSNHQVFIISKDGIGSAEYKGPNSKNVVISTGTNADNGNIKVFGDNDIKQVEIGATNSDAGGVAIYDSTGSLLSFLYGIVDSTGEGNGVFVLGDTSAINVRLESKDDFGSAEFYGPNSKNVDISTGTNADNGNIKVYGDDDIKRVEIGATNSEAGGVAIYDSTESILSFLYGVVDSTGKGDGVLDLGDNSGINVRLSSKDDTGSAEFYGPNSVNVVIKTGANTDNGNISLFNENDKKMAEISIDDENGEIVFSDTSGALNAYLGGVPDLLTGQGSGILMLNSVDGSQAVSAGDSNGNGYLEIFSDSTSSPDNLALTMYANPSHNGNGRLDIFEKGDASSPKVIANVHSTNAGIVETYGTNGSINTGTTSVLGSENYGWNGAMDNNGFNRAIMYSEPSYGGAGVSINYGQNGSLNTYIGAVIHNNRGAMAIFDESTNVKGEMAVLANGLGYVQSNVLRTLDTKASMFTNGSNQGVVQADVKNFSIAHPEDPDKRIVYACIEGPEAAAYARGTAQLINGRATIELPDHFRLVAAEEGMTVILTPLSAQSKGLAATRKSLERIEVQEMFEGQGQYEFDWEVKSIRKGYESYEVIRGNNKPHLQKSVYEYESQEGAQNK